MPSSIQTGSSPQRGTRVGPPLDHTRWMAGVVEIVAIAGAIVLAILHSAT
jgi:hypothetical protein